jgi:hypothetical protein
MHAHYAKPMLAGQAWFLSRHCAAHCRDCCCLDLTISLCLSVSLLNTLGRPCCSV